MTHLIYIYLIINSIVLGSYLLDRFNDDNLIERIYWSVILFFFGGILVLYEVTVSKYIEGGMRDSYFGFLWRLYITKNMTT